MGEPRTCYNIECGYFDKIAILNCGVTEIDEPPEGNCDDFIGGKDLEELVISRFLNHIYHDKETAICRTIVCRDLRELNSQEVLNLKWDFLD